jgi:hypothetical protein
MAISGACILIAAVFIWRRDFSTAFVVAVIGVLAWFLNYRSQIKTVNDEKERMDIEEDSE